MRPSLVPLALPPLSSVTYTLAYRAVVLHGRVGTSPVKLTNHFLGVKPPVTMTFDRQLTELAAYRRSFERSPCFINLGRLALRLGRIVIPPQVLFLGSFVITVKVTLAAYLLSKFGEQFLDQFGLAQVGFDCGNPQSLRLWLTFFRR